MKSKTSRPLTVVRHAEVDARAYLSLNSMATSETLGRPVAATSGKGSSVIAAKESSVDGVGGTIAMTPAVTVIGCRVNVLYVLCSPGLTLIPCVADREWTLLAETDRMPGFSTRPTICDAETLGDAF